MPNLEADKFDKIVIDGILIEQIKQFIQFLKNKYMFRIGSIINFFLKFSFLLYLKCGIFNYEFCLNYGWIQITCSKKVNYK